MFSSGAARKLTYTSVGCAWYDGASNGELRVVQARAPVVALGEQLDVAVWPLALSTVVRPHSPATIHCQRWRNSPESSGRARRRKNVGASPVPGAELLTPAPKGT